MTELNETRLQSLFENQAAASASEELHTRVERLAQYHDQTLWHSRAHRGRIRLAFAFGLSSVVVLGVVALTPSLVSAHTLTKIAAAMDHAASMHYKQVDITTSAPLNSFDEWYQAGRWRLQRGNGETTIYKDGVNYTYDPQTNRVTKSSRASGPFSVPVKDFKMSSILSSMGNGTHVETTKIDDGSYRLQVDNEPVHERYVFVVDSKTDLPRSMDVEKPENDVWVMKSKGVMEFNKDFDAKLFQPDFPASAQRIDLDAYKANLAKQFEKTVASLEIRPKQKLTIRDIEVNSFGQVFIVFSGPSLGSTMWPELYDETGRRYTKTDPYGYGNTSDQRLDIEDGLSLRFQWWSALGDVTPFKEHTFTLAIKKQPHIPIKGKPRGWTPGEIVEVASTSFHFTKPTVTAVPPYLSVINGRQMPTDDLDVRHAQVACACIALQNVWVDASGKKIPLPGDGIVKFAGKNTGNKRDPDALRLAYQLAKKEADLDEECAGRHGMANPSHEGLKNEFVLAMFLGLQAEATQHLQELQRVSPGDANEVVKSLDFEREIGNLPPATADLKF